MTATVSKNEIIFFTDVMSVEMKYFIKYTPAMYNVHVAVSSVGCWY